jgi:hypothetical protein
MYMLYYMAKVTTYITYNRLPACLCLGLCFSFVPPFLFCCTSLFLSLQVWGSACLYTTLSIHPSVSIQVCLSIRLSLYLPVWGSVWEVLSSVYQLEVLSGGFWGVFTSWRSCLTGSEVFTSLRRCLKGSEVCLPVWGPGGMVWRHAYQFEALDERLRGGRLCAGRRRRRGSTTP